MSDAVDYTEVPYLQEILNFLPINPDDEEDVINYIQNITNVVAVNYKYGQYRFAYFGIHLMYMTYIYCTASFCAGEYEGYDEPKDIISEQMIQSFKLSTNELLICNEMSVSSLITAHRGYQTKLKEFKKVVTEYCQKLGYI